MIKLLSLLNQTLEEKKAKRDRCLRIADRKFDKPSAYKSGAVVRCRKGDIWKDLKEGKQVGLLYHFTRTGNLITILKDNILKASDAWATNDDPRPFNSFTRNKNGWDVGGFPTDVRITIDGNKLSNKYKIQPFNMDFGVDEMEERIYKDILNIKDYILDITVYIDGYNNWEIDKDILNSLYPNINLIKDIKENDLGYSKLKGIIREIIQEESINKKIDELPQGKIFNDSKNIESIFRRSSHNWSEVIELFEKNKNKSKPDIIDIKDIHITQPNIQANKVKNMLDKVNDLSPINVVEFEDGEKVIYDGHHRLVTNWALDNNKIKVNLVKINNLQEDESLHKWFKRSGTPGKEGGWVDCNAPIRKDLKEEQINELDISKYINSWLDTGGFKKQKNLQNLYFFILKNKDM